jgi:hypothetical protein
VGPGGATFSARGAELLIGEFVGLLLEEQLECSFGQPLGRSRGDLLKRSEVHVQARPVIAEGAFGNNLCPTRGQIVKLLKFF